MMCRGSVCCGLREKQWIGAVLKGFFPVSYSSFPPALEQGFLPEHTDSHSPCTTQCVDSENSQPEVRHFRSIISDISH